MKADVTIVGGGPAGSALAVALGRRGVRVTKTGPGRLQRHQDLPHLDLVPADPVTPVEQLLDRHRINGPVGADQGVRAQPPQLLILQQDSRKLKGKVDELSVANADLSNFFASTAMPLLVLRRAPRNAADNGGGALFNQGVHYYII